MHSLVSLSYDTHSTQVPHMHHKYKRRMQYTPLIYNTPTLLLSPHPFVYTDIEAQSVITVLFEVLEYDLAQDHLVNEALTKALTALTASHDLDLSSGGRYRGLYRLLAHPNPSVRSMV